MATLYLPDMADYDDTVHAWKLIHEAMAAEKVKARVIPVTYINSAAAIKSLVGEHGGTVCTSSNAAAVLKWGWEQREKILFLPDQHLGRNTALGMGITLDTDDPHCDAQSAAPRPTRTAEITDIMPPPTSSE